MLDWLQNLRDASFLPHLSVGLVVLCSVAFALSCRQRLRPSLRDPLVVAALACLLSLIAVVALFATQPNQSPRYLLPLVPLLGTIAALVLAWPRTQLLLGAAIALVAVECLLANLMSFGHLARPMYIPLVAPERNSDRLDALNTVVDRTCTPSSANRISIVGADYPWFNFNTLTLLAAERFELSGRVCYYTSLGYAEADPSAAWRRVQEFDPPYYVSIDYGNPSNPLPPGDDGALRADDPFNRVDRAVYQRVRADRRFRLIPASRQSGFVVFQAVPKTAK